MKLFTFGCSLTEYRGIKEKLSQLLNLELVNAAQSSGSNQLQVKRFQQFVLDNKINSKDVIYWQVTFMFRKYKRLMKDHLSHLEEIQRNSFKFDGFHFLSQTKNIFDNEVRIDLMSNSPWLEQNINEMDVDYNDELQTLLSNIIIAKKITKNVIVVFGWDDVIPEDYMVIFKKYLDLHDIQYVNETYLTYTLRNNLKFLDNEFPGHPTPEAGELFAENEVYPILKKIIENENQTF